MFKSILVTGGAGFIGSHFVELFLSRYPGVRVVTVDSLTYSGNLENLAAVVDHPDHHFVKADITDRKALEKSVMVPFEIDAVVNFAAESHVDRSILDGGPFVISNVLGTQVLLDLARQFKVKRFIQVSTDEVYGTLGKTGSFSEGDALKPNSPYSASKAAADLMVRAYIETYNLPALITRCTNNYGPRQFPEKLIPLMVTNALGNESLPVYGTGENVRDWIYVGDHCDGIDVVLQRGKPGEIYNLGAACELSNLDMVKAILKILGKPESLIRFVKDRPGHDFRYSLGVTKAKNELNWVAKTPFDLGLKKTVQWYLDNKMWWENIRNGSYRDYYVQQYKNR